MNIAAETSVRELVLTFPGATRIFEQFGIDYCCGGGARTLEQGCGLANVPIELVRDSLKAAVAVPQERDWQTEPLFELIAHITSVHHRYTRAEIGRLEPLFEKVCSVHAANHPELPAIRRIFQTLGQELKIHMMKEEAVLFPYFMRMEEAVIAKEPVLPLPFETPGSPISVMIRGHDETGAALDSIRKTSQQYTLPPDACPSYRSLYESLEALEADLHQHLHLENNILFSRAMAMEPEW
jgi:regulator of cell morphogenesis and NO signaling